MDVKAKIHALNEEESQGARRVAMALPCAK